MSGQPNWEAAKVALCAKFDREPLQQEACSVFATGCRPLVFDHDLESLDSKATNSPCRCVSVLAKMAFSWFRAVSRAIPNCAAASSRDCPAAMIAARFASARDKPKTCDSNSGCGRTLPSKSEMTKSTRAPRKGERAAPWTGRIRITTGRFARRETEIGLAGNAPVSEVARN